MLHIVFPGHSRKPFEIAHGRTSKNYIYGHQSINKNVSSPTKCRWAASGAPRSRFLWNCTRTRGTTGRKRLAETIVQFQSTHPHGVRPSVCCLCIPWQSGLGFNPCSNTGETYRILPDGIPYNRYGYITVSADITKHNSYAQVSGL